MNVIAFCRDGSTTYVAVTVDALCSLAGVGLMSASLFERIALAVTKAATERLISEIEPLVQAAVARELAKMTE